MKNSIRLIGVIALGTFLYVYFSEWNFYTPTPPILLITFFLIALFLEIIWQIQNPELKLVWGIGFSLLLAAYLVLSIQNNAIYKHGFLNFESFYTENKHYRIETARKVLVRNPSTPVSFTLYEFSMNRILIRKVEEVSNNSPEICTVKFPKSSVTLDQCNRKIVPE